VGGLFGSTRAWALDDDVVHTNHGSFGGVTTAIVAAVEATRREAEANPMDTWGRRHDDLHADAVAVVADFLGAPATNTALVPNATVGMHVALRVLPWRPGARILCTDLTYPAVLAALRRRAARSGAELVPIHLDPRARADVAAATLAAALDGVDGVVVDAIASATATGCDVDAVVAAARARDVPIVVDGAHEPGQVPLDLDGRGADAWVGNLHKWACAPKSLAAVVVDPRHHDHVRAAIPSFEDDLPFPANSVWQGTADIGPWRVIGAVLAQARAIADRGDEIERLAVAGADHLAGRVDGEVLPGAGWMRTVELPVADDGLGTASAAVERFLAARGIEAKVTAVGGRPMVRVSCHAYSSARDHDRLAAGVVAALADGLVG